MPRTLKSIEQQIKKLEKEAESLRAAEVQGVVSRIREAIEHYQIGPDDLFGGRARAAKKAAKTSAPAGRRKRQGSLKGTKVAIKYRDGDGNTWTGRGSRPRWMQSAISSGKKLEDFAV